MPNSTLALPRVPRIPAVALRGLPLGPAALAMTGLARQVARRHPSLFRRLGGYTTTRFVLDPTDLPISMTLTIQTATPTIRLSRHKPKGDAYIAGPLAALLGLLHGAFDGDALFFSRDLLIEGDTAAVLALRNALDDAELDLSTELEAMSGPLAPALHRIIERLEQKTGVALTRQEDEFEW